MSRNHKRFAGKSKQGSSSKTPQLQSDPVIPSVILFRSCDKLPLDIFIDCIIDGDLSGLGTGPEVQNVWDKIYTQYLDISQDGSYNEVFELMKEINDLRGKITIVNAVVAHLQMIYDRDMVVLLNSFALQCNLEPQDIGKVLVTKLNTVIARMKRWFPRLWSKEKELETLRKAKTDKMDRAYFDDCLDIMSQERGYHIKPSDMTVSRFYRALTKLKKEEEKQEAKKLKP